MVGTTQVRCAHCGYHVDPWINEDEVVMNSDGIFHKECHTLRQEELKSNKVLEAII